MSKDEYRSSLLDEPVLGMLHINLETLLYVLLAVIAVVAVFYNLGARTMSHDESLHVLYSWKLYAGEGYEHNPMMHGPFKFHITALTYFLFGVSDFTSRIPTALFGVALVLLPAFLRRELGRVGALATSVLTLISPTTLYYARYIRDDIMMMVWAMLMAIALLRFLRSRQTGWIYLGAAAVVLAVSTMENSYIIGFIGFTFLVMLIVQNLFSLAATRTTYIVGIVLVILLTILYLGLGSAIPNLPMANAELESQGLTQQTATKIREVVFLLVGILVTMLVGMVLIQREEQLRPVLRLVVAYGATILSLVVICAGLGGLAWLAIIQLPEGLISPLFFLVLQMVAVAVGIGLAAYLWWLLFRWARSIGMLPEEFSTRAMFITIALVVVIFSLLYTTFFTNPKGLGTGTFGAISYWLAQQEVKRAGQPWYYYLIIAPIYEFLPIGLGLIAGIYYLVTGRVNRPGERVLTPVVAYLVYWTMSAWLIYSWAGEKMPWLLVHIIQPMLVLSGRFIDDVVAGVDWRRVWQKGGAVLALIVPVLLLALGLIVGLPLFGQAFDGMSLTDLDDTSRWLTALVIGAPLVYFAQRIAHRLGRRQAGQVVFLALLVIGALFTLRYAVMASYVNYDTAKEFLVYAHGTPDVKRTVRELQAISERLYGSPEAIRFTYSSDATWPFEWYFDRLFPNRVFIGRDPTRENLDSPVLVIGRDEIAKVEPYLGNRYYRFDRKLVWWPHQDYYMGLSLAMPREEERQAGKNYFLLDMGDPEKRRAFFNVLFYRQYAQTLAEWEPAHPFAFYVRKDVAAQMWDMGIAPAAVDIEAERDNYSKNVRTLDTVAVWGGPGTEQGRFTNPRNIAIAPDGSVYVADSGNHRIQKFAPDGQFVTMWGHLCRFYEDPGSCEAPDGAGGFYDPWDVAVDQDGFVYVADTWNHRIQKFTADGQFVTMWGSYAISESGVGDIAKFWGPRDITIDEDGLLYVSDTGNKRIQVFTPDGDYVTQWGGKGTLSGKFNEPVGVAIAPGGRTYVADTWNQRIQVFDAAHFFLLQWPVDTWLGNSLDNKPYLAVDAQGRLYATDPEGYRILVFDQNGNFIISIGEYGSDDRGFILPTGMAIDEQGYIWVTDAATHRVLKLTPLQ